LKGVVIIVKRFEEAHRFSSYHRRTLSLDAKCGCFHCLRIFNPSKITDWIDSDETALCPYCGIDSVIGQSSGFPITDDFFKKMHEHWF
jgi:hypothetical protein